MANPISEALSDDVLQAIHERAEYIAEEAYVQQFDRDVRDRARLMHWRAALTPVVERLVEYDRKSTLNDCHWSVSSANAQVSAERCLKQLAEARCGYLEQAWRKAEARASKAEQRLREIRAVVQQVKNWATLGFQPHERYFTTLELARELDAVLALLSDPPAGGESA